MITYSSKSFSLKSANGLHIAIPALLTKPSIDTSLKRFSRSARDVDQLLRDNKMPECSRSIFFAPNNFNRDGLIYIQTSNRVAQLKC